MNALINNVGNAFPSLVTPRLPVHVNPFPRNTTPTTHREEDKIEISSLARVRSRELESSSFNLARLQAIRAEIAAGTYETPARIEATALRLLDVLA